MALSTAFSSLASKNVVVRYAAALIAVVIALELGRLANPLTGSVVGYALVFLSLTFASWYCGVGPSVVVAILGIAGLELWVASIETLQAVSASAILGLLVLAVVFAIIIVMGHSRRIE